MPDPSALTGALDVIREHATAVSRLRLENPGIELGTAAVLLSAAADVPRLLAAVDAVLARHVPRTVTVRNLCPAHSTSDQLRRMTSREERAVIDACPDCRREQVTECAGCDPACPDGNAWPCADVRAITRELPGGQEDPGAPH